MNYKTAQGQDRSSDPWLLGKRELQKTPTEKYEI